MASKTDKAKKSSKKSKAKYPAGLNMSIQDWALSTLEQCANQYGNRMDCATVYCLWKLSMGHVFDFVAFKYVHDAKEALGIVTDDMNINGMSLGFGVYIRYKDMSTLCQSLSTHGNELGAKLIALKTGDIERVYLEPIGFTGSLDWSKDAKAAISEHQAREAADEFEKHACGIFQAYVDGSAPRADVSDLMDRWPDSNQVIVVNLVRPLLDEMSDEQLRVRLAAVMEDNDNCGFDYGASIMLFKVAGSKIEP